MGYEPYLVLKPGIARLRGRAEEWKLLLRRLEKPVPDHVSVIGPRYIGKTVLLNAVNQYLSEKQDHFNGCAYWNIGHDTPKTDPEFYRKFASYVSKAIIQFDSAMAKELDQDGIGYEILGDAFEMLEEDGKRILVIMDGFDHLRYYAELTKNLWDSLRALAEKSSLRFLMGSQRPLREICAMPEARTSPFWNVFADSTLKLNSFVFERDWEDMLSPFADRKIQLEKGAPKELFNFSGGIPVLASALCKRVWESVEDGSLISNSNVVEFSEGFVEHVRSILDDLWDDCDAEEQGVVGYLAEGHTLDAVSVPKECLFKLKQRGFIMQSGQALAVCRPVVEYVKIYRPQATDLRRLFGTIDDYRNNIASVIELRALQLETMAGVDKQLAEYIRSAVEKLDRPHLVVNEIRGLVNRALTLIWDRELPDRKIPDEWVAGWKMEDLEGNPPERKPPEGQVPGSAGRQCYLLSLMTDPRKAGSTRVSRSTYLMIDYLQSVGDFGQHLGDAQVPQGFTSTVTLTAIELCEQLAA